MGLALDEPQENEKTNDINGIKILIAGDVLDQADGKTLDYVNTPNGDGFTVTDSESYSNSCS